jgi:hypothetical protein
MYLVQAHTDIITTRYLAAARSPMAKTEERELRSSADGLAVKIQGSE